MRALYHADEKTWFDLVNDFGRDIEVTFRWKQYIANAVTIDFGDGSEPYTTASTGDVETTHIYSPGTYRAKMSGGYNLRGVSNGCCVSDMLSGGSSLLRKVFCGSVNYFYSYSFLNCVNLESISIRNGCALSGVNIFLGCSKLSIGNVGKREDIRGVSNGVFNDCYGINIVSFPDNTIVLNNQGPNIKRAVYSKKIPWDNLSCANNRRITDVKITDCTTILAARAFQSCTGLTRLSIPASVQTIKSNCFYGVSNLRVLKFEGVTPPAVENANAWASFPADCIVEVPMGSLDAYKNATNYSPIAAQMVGV